jgi:Haemolysin-III related
MNVVDKSLALPRWTQSAGEELANSISHGIGLVGAMIGTPILLLAAFRSGSISFLIGTIIFTVTMMLLYLGSMLYHAWPRTRVKFFLQTLDHAAIFLLIAGTYTPFALGPLRGTGGLAMLGIVWTLALFGVFMKATRGTLRHRKLAMSLYRDGVAGSRLHTPTCPGDSVVGGPVVNRRRHRLHSGHFVFRERAAALRAFCLASVRPCGHVVPFCGRAHVRRLTTTRALHA